MSCRQGFTQCPPILTSCSCLDLLGFSCSCLGPFPTGGKPKLPSPISWPFFPLQEVQKGLQDRGQNQTRRLFFLNVVQAVSQDGACVYAAADPRKGGEASGY